MALRILPENHFDVATVTVTPVAVAAAPVTNLQSNIRDRYWRSPNLNPQVIEGNWGGNGRVISAMAIRGGSRGLMGMRGRLEIFGDLAKTTTVHDSGVVDFFTFGGPGYGLFAYGGGPYGLDSTDKTAHLALFALYFAGVVGFAFRLTLYNGGAIDTSYMELSRIWLADYVDAPFNPQFGAAPQWRPASQVRRTVGGTLRRLARPRTREMRFTIELDSEVARYTWSDLMYLADPSVEIVLSVFAGEGSRRERDFTVMGSLETLNAMAFQGHDYHELPLAILES